MDEHRNIELAGLECLRNVAEVHLDFCLSILSLAELAVTWIAPPSLRNRKWCVVFLLVEPHARFPRCSICSCLENALWRSGCALWRIVSDDVKINSARKFVIMPALV